MKPDGIQLRTFYGALFFGSRMVQEEREEREIIFWWTDRLVRK